jgi:hypothetical protein
MRIPSMAVSLAGLLFSACAATTPAPRLSVVDPADPSGPESPSPPRSNVLRDRTTSSDALAPGAVRETYACPRHPRVARSEPGACPICGAALVPKKAADSQGSEPR